jgi:hypothetical protein
MLLSWEPVASFFSTRQGRIIAKHLTTLAPKEAYVLACLPAIGQEHVLSLLPTGAHPHPLPALCLLASSTSIHAERTSAAVSTSALELTSEAAQITPTLKPRGT